MSKRTLACLLALCLVVSFSASTHAEYLASKKSMRYHFPSCKWAQKIGPQNLIVFKTMEEAKKAGATPCKVCRPPGAHAIAGDQIGPGRIGRNKIGPKEITTGRIIPTRHSGAGH